MSKMLTAAEFKDYLKTICEEYNVRVISQKLRDSALGRDCTLRFEHICNFNPETTVLAHVPCGHKGIGMKGPDFYACWSCSSCHAHLDSYDADIDWRQVMRAVAETQMHWVREGLLVVKGMKA